MNEEPLLPNESSQQSTLVGAQEMSPELSFENIAQEISPKLSFENIAQVSPELTFENIAQVSPELSFENIAQEVSPELSFENIAQAGAGSTVLEKRSPQNSLDALGEALRRQFPPTSACTGEGFGRRRGRRRGRSRSACTRGAHGGLRYCSSPLDSPLLGARQLSWCKTQSEEAVARRSSTGSRFPIWRIDTVEVSGVCSEGAESTYQIWRTGRNRPLSDPQIFRMMRHRYQTEDGRWELGECSTELAPLEQADQEAGAGSDRGSEPNRSLEAEVLTLREELKTERAKCKRLEEEKKSIARQLQHSKSAIENLVKALRDERARSSASEKVEEPRGGSAAQANPRGSADGLASKAPAAGSLAAQGVLDVPDAVRWARTPLGRHLAVTAERRTAAFVGEEGHLHSVVCTAEPPLTQRGYGFEVSVGSVGARARDEIGAGTRDELAVGFTSLPPGGWPGGIGETWLAGYDRGMWRGARGWVDVPWSMPRLKAGDRIRVLATHAGLFEVCLNEKILWRTEIPLARGDPPLYGVVDLLGCVQEVTLRE